MITISGTLSKGWMAKALGVSFDRDYYFNPDRRYVIDCKCNEYAAAQFPEMRLFYSESNLGQINYWDKNQIQIGGIQPNMILGMLLGADFVPHDSYDADISPGCLLGKDPEDLPAPESLLDHELVTLFDNQIRKVQNDFQKQLRPIPPFFWDTSGRAAIHGTMTSAQKFLGETFFMDMIAKPQRCLEIMGWIADAFIVLCRHFSQIANLPITSVHVGECSACMVSPELIEKFVVPVTSKIGERLGPVRLHSCGPGTNHLEAFLKTTNLRSLDLGGDTSIQKARQIFGKDMLISVAPLPRDMSNERTEPIVSWAKRIFEENDGGNLECVYHVEENYNIDTILALTDYVINLPDIKKTKPEQL
ncbi:uroporphyrinogen decarboxylase family protein [Planctomycetota bacterium]